MKRNVLVGALATGLALMIAGSTAAAADNKDASRVMVKYKPGSKAQVQQALKASGARVHYTFDELGVFAVSVPEQALKGLRNNPNVEYIENDALRYPSAQTIPYGIDMVQARQVWDNDLNGEIDAGAATGEGMLVCVIDSGIEAGHEDFAGVNLVGGFPKDSWNYDNCGHGTHVAGTIAAANNDLGVVGVTPGKASLYIVKVFGNEDAGQCTWTFSSQLIDAANRCAARGARVINMSLGGDAPTRAESQAFENLNKRGILSVAAAGNDGNPANPIDLDSYPASYDAVLSVGAVDSTKALASFSQKNEQVELTAPGVAVLSTAPSFFAPPVVSGGEEYASVPMANTLVASVTAPLVSGGLCNTPAGDNSWVGKVVLCQRGAATFLVKSQNVAGSGGLAAVIYNNVAGPLNGTLGDDLSVIPAIPVTGIALTDGQDLLASHIAESTTVNTQLQVITDSYEIYNGTSMATPHVAGVAALIWSANPGWTNQQIREALEVTAEDLGAPGHDPAFGWGLIRAKDALDYLESQ